ncbi:hypothetical protein niasHT_011421 [Heterodera trifolii]|uniref:Uncharacterized protein n=1 Tax=Heterodera trifolii TaxID=157864 RepID=A0ABD2LK01_9BILA
MGVLVPFYSKMKPSTDLWLRFFVSPYLAPVSNEGKAGCQYSRFLLVNVFSKIRVLKFVDIVLEPTTLLLSPLGADAQQRLIMCKVRAEADCVTFCTENNRTIGGGIGNSASLLREIRSKRIEHNRTFHVNCRPMRDFVFGVFPNGRLAGDGTGKNDILCTFPSVRLLWCAFGNVVGAALGILARVFWAFRPFCRPILRAPLAAGRAENCVQQIRSFSSPKTLTIGKGSDRSGDGGFLSMESFLAWMILNKCEQSLFRQPLIGPFARPKSPPFGPTRFLIIWLSLFNSPYHCQSGLLEPYVLLTKGVLLLYKCFDTFDSKQDPRANGCDSSVGILELPTDSCLRLTEMLLSSSLSLPPPLRALGQFYVGFIRMKDRVD